LLRGALAAVVLCPRPSGAAELSWSSSEDCGSAVQFVEQVEAQIGASLASVDGIDFEVTIARDAHKRWRLTLVSIEQPDGERRVRVLTGETCAEVTDAGAVALAMAIGAKQEAPAESEPPPEKKPQPRETSVPRRARPQGAPLPAHPLSVVAAAGIVADIGGLPDPAFGAEVDAGVRWRKVRLMAFGTVFGPDRTVASSGRGGEFQLWVAGALACLERPGPRLGALACAGYEIGNLLAEGTGVTDPRSESALWHALRADLGALVPLGSGFSGALRFGAVMPIERREFVLDSSDVVHQPNSVTGRVMAGLDVDF
jgi:hypothetical protein